MKVRSFLSAVLLSLVLSLTAAHAAPFEPMDCSDRDCAIGFHCQWSTGKCVPDYGPNGPDGPAPFVRMLVKLFA